MQIEPENTSPIPRSSELDGKPTNTSQVTSQGRYELVHASCPLTAEDLNGAAKFRKKAEANGWGPALRRLHSPWSLGAKDENRWEGIGRCSGTTQTCIRCVLGRQTPGCLRLGSAHLTSI